MDDSFHPNQIRQLVFDLNSLSEHLSGDPLLNFREVLRVLEERGFRMLLLAEDADPQAWSFLKHASLLSGSVQEIATHNPDLRKEHTFWISEDPITLEWLDERQVCFGSAHQSMRDLEGLQYQYLNDLLQIFNPSRLTALELALSLSEMKSRSPRMPLTIGIGGQEDCGHAFFVGELVDALESLDLLVAGLDLTELLGLEFADSGYWRTPEMRSWVLDLVLGPFSRGETVILERGPKFLEALEVTVFPFYSPPEGVLLVWGSTLFLPEFRNLLDLRIHLDVSPREAAARLFSMDQEETFDPAFVDSYLEREGRLYETYLAENDAESEFDFRVDFDNFNAFRLKP